MSDTSASRERRDVLFRVAVDADAAPIARLIRESKIAAMPWLPLVHTPDEDVRWVAGVLLPEHAVTVAASEGHLVGVLAASPGWIDQLYVAPDLRGRGIGSRLLRAALEAATGPVQLWTFQRNRRARDFYERHGFVEVRSTDGDNEEKEPDVLYRWEPNGIGLSPA
jgi:GNAT superfamily N-acetyltransferase